MSKLLELQQKYGAALDVAEKHVATGGKEYEDAMAEVKTLGENIDRVKAFNASKALHAVEVPKDTTPETKGIGHNSGDLVPATAKAKLEPGTRISRAIIALAANKGIGRLAAEFAAEKWDQSTPEVSKALAASVGPSGGFLVPEDFRVELIGLLRPVSVVMRAGPRIIDLPHGNLTLPGVATGAQAEYVGENQNIKKTEQTFRTVTLSAKKLAALVPISNDMLRYPSIATDAFVRQDLLNALAERADTALLRGNGTEFSPRGLRAWAIAFGAVVQSRSAAAPFNVANVTADLAEAELRMAEGNLPMTRLVWFMSPRTKTAIENLRDGNANFVFPTVGANGTLRGKPIFQTTKIPNNIGANGNGSEIYLVDMAEFIIGESIDMELTVLDGAAYHDGQQIISGFSQDQTVIRAMTAHDTGMRYGGTAVLIDDVRWLP